MFSEKKLFQKKENSLVQLEQDPRDVFLQVQKEADLIKISREDRNVDGELLVYPNGPVSKLSEEFWKIVRTPSFKSWFKKSDVVDENGEPALVFHTTEGDLENFDSFSDEISQQKRAQKLNLAEGGHYFTSGKYEYGHNRISVFLSAKVKRVENQGDIANIRAEEIEKVKRQGYSGMVYEFSNAEVEIEKMKKKYRRHFTPKTFTDHIFFGFNKIFNNDYSTTDRVRDMSSIKDKSRDLHSVRKEAVTSFFEVLVFEPSQIMIVSKESNFKDPRINKK
jgi:hypothetical protein